MTYTDPARTRRDDIKAVRTTRKTYDLLPHQYWCETRHAFEIWQPIDGQNQMLERIPRKSVITLIKTLIGAKHAR
jgi:hypothetical protein